LLPRAEIIWDAPPELPLQTWPMESRREFFLFFKEALTNIARHARATRVWIALRGIGQRLELELRDNGRGFDPAHTAVGLGLQSLRDRAATLHGEVELTTAAEAGTCVRLRIPLHQP
jgi:signal transduction histidine kinase